MADDKVLEKLLSDSFFSRFDSPFWLDREWPVRNFAEKGFPALVLYYDGIQLNELIQGHQWLGDLAFPSKRHEAAFIFQREPARNLTVAEKRAIIADHQQQGRSPPRTEANAGKDVEEQSSALDPDLEQKEVTMQREFGESWTDFVKGNYENFQLLAKSEDDEYLNHHSNWLHDHRFLGSDQTQDLLRRAMKAFLVNSTKADFYGGRSWTQSAAIDCWIQIKEIEPSRISGFISSEPDEFWRDIKSGWLRKITAHGKLWYAFSENISSFCLAAGCPKAITGEPFKNLEILRDVVSRQFLYTADLHNRISELSQQIVLQQRMITALAYRHVLESLTAETPGHNATQKWQSFLEKMFRNVESDDGKIPSNNPFNNLFDQHKIDKKYPIGYLKGMAKELYSTLSRTIHNFQPSKDFGQYTPMPGQFDPMQIDFLVAMKPESTNLNDDGNPNWEKERARYPGQIDDVGLQVKAKIQTRKTAKILTEQEKPRSKKDDDEDAILAISRIGLIDPESMDPVETRSSGEDSSTSGDDSESGGG